MRGGCGRLRAGIGAGLLALIALLAGGNAAAQERPLLVVEQGAHSAPVRRIDVNTSRGLAVTASDDRTARVWDLATGEQRHVLRPLAFGAEGGRMYGVAIHPTEPLVAVAGTTGGDGNAHLIYLFDLGSGSLRRTVDAKAGDIRKLAWSADGSVLLAGYNGTHGLRAFALDGRQLLDDRFDGPVFGVATASNGLAAAVSLDGRLRVYKATAGAVTVLHNVSLAPRRSAAVAFSPDGRQLVVAYADRAEPPELFDAESARPVARLPAPTIFASDSNTGRAVSASDRSSGDLRVLAWSADGKTISAGGTARTREYSYPIVQYDVASRRINAQVDVARDSVTDLATLPSGDLAYTSFDGSWGVLREGKVVVRNAAEVAAVRGDAPEDLEISPEARAVNWATKGERGGFGFAFDRRKLVVGPRQGLRAPETRFGLFNAPTDWNKQQRPPVIGGKAMPLAADERGRALVVARGNPAAAIVGTNRALYRVDERGEVVWRIPVDTEIRAVNASADGRLLVSAMADGTVRWWRAADGTLLLTLLATADGRWVVWTPSGYYDASAGADRIVGWALPRGQQQAMSYFSLNRFRERFNRPDLIDAVLRTLDEAAAFTALASAEDAARDAAVSDAERQEAAARVAERTAIERAEQARVAALREAEVREQAERAAREAVVKAEAARVAEARRQASLAEARARAERDAAEREAETRRIAALAEAQRDAARRESDARRAAAEARALAEREAAAREAAAREADSREAARREADARRAAAEARAQAERDTAARELAAREAALREAVAREAAREAAEREAAAKARKALAQLKALEFPPALLRFEAQRIKATGPEVTLPFAVNASAPGGEVTVEVRVNGRPARPADLQIPKNADGSTRGFAKLAVGPGETVVELIARNGYGVSEPLSFNIERDALAPAAGGTRPGSVAAAPSDLYVLAIGVADYARPDYKLGLSAKDARDFASAMKAQEGKQYRRVIVKTLTNAEATRLAIAREFEWLRSSVGPGDVAMLFMAGHGLNDATGQYFFLPYDGQHERLLATAVPQTSIVATLSRIRGKTLFFVDTCFAGNSLGALAKAGRKTEKFINDLSASENGVVVFASSTGHEESEEKDEWGNGAFTKALIDGLGGKADFMRAGRVTFAGLNLFISEEVQRMTEGRQRPVFISPRGVPDFALARL